MLQNNLLVCYPEVAAEWDYALNEKRPEEFQPYSNKRAHWICPAGHQYEARINNRVRSKGNGCPYCAGQAVLKGFNDLASQYPDIASQWHLTKNGNLDPTMVTAKSNREVVWLCEICGMEWKTKVYHRVEGQGCPYCAGQRPIPGKTDLPTLYPGIEKLWSSMNGSDDLPQNYTSKSHSAKYWMCSEGHLYQAPIGRITNAWDTIVQKGQMNRLFQCGCPICNRSKIIIRGENDLESQAPWLMEEWDYAKNGDIHPWEIAVHSNIHVNWICRKGHRWLASPNNRAKTGCPVCNSNKLMPGENSLDVVDPLLAKQWSPRNLPETPRDVTAFCNKKYYWICPDGHEWQATVSNRHLGEGCPYCTHRKPIIGQTDLKTRYPEIAAQFLSELNDGKRPEDYLPFSGERVVWTCERGHTWKASIASRTRDGTGCPHCLGLRKTNRHFI